MKTKIPKNINLTKFLQWIKKNTDCEVRMNGQCLEAVVFANHIEPGRCVPLVAEMDDDVLEITEFSVDCYNPRTAQAAIDSGEDAYSPVPFYEWVQDQYLTAKGVKVEKVEL